MHPLTHGVVTRYSILSLLRWMDLRNGAKWTHFNDKGAIVSYNNFKYGSRDSYARYRDGFLSKRVGEVL